MTQGVGRPGPSGRALVVALALLPWAWFAVRDTAAAFDGLALLLPPVVGGLVVVHAVAARLLRDRRLLVAAGSWLVVGVLAVVGPWLPRSTGAPEDPVRIVAANVLEVEGSVALVDDITAQDGDVVVVSEVSESVDAALRRRFPSSLRSEVSAEVGLYAEVTLERLPTPAGLRPAKVLRARVEDPVQPFVLYAVHLPKPGLAAAGDFQLPLAEHAAMVDRLVAAVRTEALPAVVAGDLNVADRTSGYRTLTGELRDAMRGRWAAPTSVKPGLLPLLLRIDHILVPSAWCAQAVDRFGLTDSDHRGVAATVGRCAEGGG